MASYRVVDYSTTQPKPVHPSCLTETLECNPLWNYKDALSRAIVQLVGSFALVLTCVLISVSYDGSAPMTSAAGAAIPYYLLTSLNPGYNFNPIFTIVGGLILATPCCISGSVDGALYKFNIKRLFTVQLWRVAFDVSCQVIGSILAATLIWDVMRLGETNNLSRFDGVVRDDLVLDPLGGPKIFLYVLLFSTLFAIVCYHIRYTDKNPTCVTVQATLSQTKIGIMCLAFFSFSAALAPVIGCGSLNIIGSIGTYTATRAAPVFFVYVVFGQLIGFGTVALMYRWFVHRCPCTVQPVYFWSK